MRLLWLDPLGVERPLQGWALRQKAPCDLVHGVSIDVDESSNLERHPANEIKTNYHLVVVKTKLI